MSSRIISQNHMSNISLFTKNVTKSLHPPGVDCSPFPLNLCGKPWGWGKIPPTSQKIISKIPLLLLLVFLFFTLPFYFKLLWLFGLIKYNIFQISRNKSYAVKSFISSPSSNHPMQSLFVAAVISVVSCFKLQALCTHMSC